MGLCANLGQDCELERQILCWEVCPQTLRPLYEGDALTQRRIQSQPSQSPLILQPVQVEVVDGRPCTAFAEIGSACGTATLKPGEGGGGKNTKSGGVRGLGSYMSRKKLQYFSAEHFKTVNQCVAHPP